nr:MAG TPA: hypothetical protein [Caudoviricetes sp.]
MRRPVEFPGKVTLRDLVHVHFSYCCFNPTVQKIYLLPDFFKKWLNLLNLCAILILSKELNTKLLTLLK